MVETLILLRFTSLANDNNDRNPGRGGAGEKCGIACPQQYSHIVRTEKHKTAIYSNHVCFGETSRLVTPLEGYSKLPPSSSLLHLSVSPFCKGEGKVPHISQIIYLGPIDIFRRGILCRIFRSIDPAYQFHALDHSHHSTVTRQQDL